MRRTLLLAGVLALAAAPAVLNLVWPETGEAAVNRTVALSGPIQSFSQSGDRIQIRLALPEAGAAGDTARELVVSSSDGSVMTILLRPGQTWASSALPPALATAGTLNISIR